jgi:hypothetical protein
MSPPDGLEPEEPTRKLYKKPLPPYIRTLIQRQLDQIKAREAQRTSRPPRTTRIPGIPTPAELKRMPYTPKYKTQSEIRARVPSATQPWEIPKTNIAGPILTTTIIAALTYLLHELKEANDPTTSDALLQAIATQGEFIAYYTGQETDIVDVRVSDPSIRLAIGSTYGRNLRPGLILIFDELPTAAPRWARITINCKPPTRQYISGIFSLQADDGWALPYFHAHLLLHDGFNSHFSGFSQDITQGLFQITLVSPTFSRRLSCTLGNQSFPTTWSDSSWSIDLNAGVYLGMSTHGDVQDIATAEYNLDASTEMTPNNLTLYFGTDYPDRNLIYLDSAFLIQYGPPIRDPFTASTMGLTEQELKKIAPDVA